MEKVDDPESEYQKLYDEASKNPGVCELAGYLDKLREAYLSSEKHKNDLKNLRYYVIPGVIVPIPKETTSNKIS